MGNKARIEKLRTHWLNDLISENRQLKADIERLKEQRAEMTKGDVKEYLSRKSPELMLKSAHDRKVAELEAHIARINADIENGKIGWSIVSDFRKAVKEMFPNRGDGCDQRPQLREGVDALKARVAELEAASKRDNSLEKQLRQRANEMRIKAETRVAELEAELAQRDSPGLDVDEFYPNGDIAE